MIPLEGEIKALKEKLRSADEEIQKLRSAAGVSTASESNHSSALVGMLIESKSNQKLDQNDSNAGSDINSGTTTTAATDLQPTETDCPNCKNVESQFLAVKTEKESLQKDIERFNEELSNEAALRRDLESKWQENRDKYIEQVQKLTQKVEYNEKELSTLQRHYTAFKDEVNEEFTKMTNEREMVHRHLTTLQDDNDFLSGRYMASSEEIQNQFIDLPSTVDELQEILLQSNQSLVEARVGCEYAQRKCTAVSEEVQFLRDQFQATTAERQASDRDFIARIKGLEYVPFQPFVYEDISNAIYFHFRTHLKAQESERLRLLNLKDIYEKKENEWNKQSSELNGQLIELRESYVSTIFDQVFSRIQSNYFALHMIFRKM